VLSILIVFVRTALDRAQWGKTALHRAAERGESGAVIVAVLMELVQADGAEADPSRRTRADADEDAISKRTRSRDAK